MIVKAKAGLKVPHHSNSYRYHSEEPHEVEMGDPAEIQWITRRLMDGDLIECPKSTPLIKSEE